jgi:uncharacterized protein (DUF1330 family)
MPVYLIADVTITDDSWVPNYGANVHHIVHKHGGKYLARSGNITTMEGDEQGFTLVGIIEFPSMQAFDAFKSDPAYAPFGEARRAGSDSKFRVIDDTDIAGTIPYLTKG